MTTAPPSGENNASSESPRGESPPIKSPEDHNWVANPFDEKDNLAAIANGHKAEASIEKSSEPSEATVPSRQMKSGIQLDFLPSRFLATQLNLGWIIVGAIGLMILGLAIDRLWMGLVGAFVALLISVSIILPNWSSLWTQLVPAPWRSLIAASLGIMASGIGLLMLSGSNQQGTRAIKINWDAVGAVGEIVGALGQILIALLAVYVAWQQYVISKDLTIQQNRITQQQTIDAYFQGVSDLALNDEGFLEDWPQERAFAEGRTAAILSSVDAVGKAKIIRFLSQSKLLAPLRRDRLLGRPILDGRGGYAEDRAYGTRVIDLGVMLAGADFSGNDLRWTELSDANLVRANLSRCDLVKANLARAILYEANLSGADLKGTRLFYGTAQTATPRSRTESPDYQTGEQTGAVVENAKFIKTQRLSDAQRYYCCAWGGSKTRKTIPGGCEGIPNKLGR